MNKDFKDNKEEKEPELIKKAKNEIIEFCPKCNSTEIYEVFINKLWRCKKCNFDNKLN